MVGSSGSKVRRDLARYVSRTMKTKGLSARDVAEGANGQITRAGVEAIRKGTAKSPTVDAILGLARGLSVDRYEIFNIACGPREPQKSEPGFDEILETSELVELLNGERLGPWLRAIVQNGARLEPNELEALLLTVYRLISAKEDRSTITGAE